MHKKIKVQPQKTEIHRDFIEKLSNEEKYSLILLSNIHNEISTLMRMLLHAFPKAGLTPIEQSGSFHMMQLFAKLLCGKIYEADIKIYQKPVQDFIKKWCTPYETLQSIDNVSTEFKKSIKANKWLTQARNRHAMHYPKPNEWSEAIDFLSKNNFEIIVGGDIDEMLFRTADVASFVSLSLDIHQANVTAGIEKFAREIGPLARNLTLLTSRCLGGFVQASKKSDKNRNFTKHKKSKSFETIRYDELEIPYFFHYENKNSD